MQICCVYKIYIKSDYDFRNRFMKVLFINLIKTIKWQIMRYINSV